MKHDPYFKYLAAALIAGVILAIIDPTPDLARPGCSPAVTANTTITVAAKG
jgi:hypothetical protein